jgi:hypothetical protein
LAYVVAMAAALVVVVVPVAVVAGAVAEGGNNANALSGNDDAPSWLISFALASLGEKAARVTRTALAAGSEPLPLPLLLPPALVAPLLVVRAGEPKLKRALVADEASAPAPPLPPPPLLPADTARAAFELPEPLMEGSGCTRVGNITCAIESASCCSSSFLPFLPSPLFALRRRPVVCWGLNRRRVRKRRTGKKKQQPPSTSSHTRLREEQSKAGERNRSVAVTPRVCAPSSLAVPSQLPRCSASPSELAALAILRRIRRHRMLRTHGSHYITGRQQAQDNRVC